MVKTSKATVDLGLGVPVSNERFANPLVEDLAGAAIY